MLLLLEYALATATDATTDIAICVTPVTIIATATIATATSVSYYC